MPPCARRMCGHGIQRHHGGPCQRCGCPSFLYPWRDQRATFNQETAPMARKPPANASAPTASTTTVQIGLAAALGDGSTQKPDAFNVRLDLLRGRIEKPDPTRYDVKGTDSHSGLPSWPEFVDSIRERGLDTPIIVRPVTVGEGYDIVEGRHRALAHQLLRLTEVPALRRLDYDEGDAAMAEIVTNTQRSRGGNPYREGLALRKAMQAKGWTAEEAGRRAGRSPSWVHERLRILQVADAGGAAGEQLAHRVGHSISLEDLKPVHALLAIPKDLPNRDELIQTGLAAAAKTTRTDSYGLEEAISKSLEAHGAVVVGHNFADYEVREDPSFKKAIAKLPGFTLARSSNRIILDGAAAKAAKAAAVERLTVRDNKKRGPGDKQVDQTAMMLRRLGKLQADAVTQQAKGKVSYGRDFEKVLVLRWLRNLGAIGTRNVDRALMKEVAGIAKWDGRGNSLVSHVEKAWGKTEAGRIMHVALFLETDRRQSYMTGHGVPDPYAALLLGKTNAAFIAQAKRDVTAELNASKKDTKKPAAKAAVEKARAKGRKTRPAAVRLGELAEQASDDPGSVDVEDLKEAASDAVAEKKALRGKQRAAGLPTPRKAKGSAAIHNMMVRQGIHPPMKDGSAPELLPEPDGDGRNGNQGQGDDDAE